MGVFMVRYGCLWVPIGVYGFLGVYGYLWVSMGAYGFPGLWVFMGIMGVYAYYI